MVLTHTPRKHHHQVKPPPRQRVASGFRVRDPSKLEEEKKEKGSRRDSLFRFSRFSTEPVSFWNLEPGTRFYLVNHRHHLQRGMLAGQAREGRYARVPACARTKRTSRASEYAQRHMTYYVVQHAAEPHTQHTTAAVEAQQRQLQQQQAWRPAATKKLTHIELTNQSQ